MIVCNGKHTKMDELRDLFYWGIILFVFSYLYAYWWYICCFQVLVFGKLNVKQEFVNKNVGNVMLMNQNFFSSNTSVA